MLREKKRDRERERGKMLIVPGTLTDLTESVFIEKLRSEVLPCSFRNRRREARGNLTGSVDSRLQIQTL